MFLSSMEQVGSVLDFSFFPFQPKKVILVYIYCSSSYQQICVYFQPNHLIH